MHRILILVEGATERAVVQQVLAPHFGNLNLSVQPKVIGKPGHKGGGARPFASVQKEILALLKQERSGTVTMFFDYYGMPESWPGVHLAKGQATEQIPETIEAALALELTRVMGSEDPARFVPYVQMHELEALLFASPKTMAEEFERPGLESDFVQIVKECGGCEKINDNPSTSPSKRIQNLFPRYRKGSGARAHAPIITKKIGLGSMRLACPHFNYWLTRLERLGKSPS